MSDIAIQKKRSISKEDEPNLLVNFVCFQLQEVIRIVCKWFPPVKVSENHTQDVHRRSPQTLCLSLHHHPHPEYYYVFLMTYPMHFTSPSFHQKKSVLLGPNPKTFLWLVTGSDNWSPASTSPSATWIVGCTMCPCRCFGLPLPPS